MKLIPILFCFLLSITELYAKVEIIKPTEKHAASFAIVIDSITYNRTKDAVKEYKNSIENDGLSVYTLIDNWKNPDVIKSELIKLYKNSPELEGAVFIGDIPIPMIINAQYMTTSFKLDEEKYSIERSAVPSDRFYDDFDLRFKFLSQDTVHTLYYYYSLLSSSPQKIEKEIYSGRIKPPVDDDSKYGMIRKYLFRVAIQKRGDNHIDDMFVYTGHGYYSQSLASWADERISLSEQFPQLYKTGGRIKNIHHEMNQDMKAILLQELQDTSLDIAVFHAHGSSDAQLIIDYPDGESVPENIESIKFYLRSKLRSAKERNKSIGDTKQYFIDHFEVPSDWFEGAFVDSVITADSILTASLDIYSEDIDKISPQAKFIIFDECFNGSFHKKNYIAGKYIFSDGNTIAAEANSVNSLQDNWADSFLGLLNLGVRIGQWHKLNNFLESHIIGDPTFRFKNTYSDDSVKPVFNFQNNNEYWKKYLKDDNPVLRSIAINKLFKLNDRDISQKLVFLYNNDPSFNVRLHALKCLADLNNDEFHQILKKSINDSYELIRRFSIIWMGEIGLEEYLPYMIKQIQNDESNRISFNGINGLSFINTQSAITETKKYFDSLEKTTYNINQKKKLLGTLNRNKQWLYDEIIPGIKNDSLKLSKRIQEVRTFRNYRFHEAIPELIILAEDKSIDKKLRAQIYEALGWFNLSFEKNNIITSCNKIIMNQSEPDIVRNEATRTKKRLITGLNNSIIP